MNSAKRGPAYGFRLPTFTRVSTTPVQVSLPFSLCLALSLYLQIYPSLTRFLFPSLSLFFSSLVLSPVHRFLKKKTNTHASSTQLLDTKSHDRKQTLLHFVVRTVEEHYPQAERFVEDLADVTAASRVSLVTLASDVKGIRKGIDLVGYELEKQPGNFVLYCFYQSAIAKGRTQIERERENTFSPCFSVCIVGQIRDLFTRMEERYNRCCVLYNELPEKTEPFEFFAVFAKFIQNWKVMQTCRSFHHLSHFCLCLLFCPVFRFSPSTSMSVFISWLLLIFFLY